MAKSSQSFLTKHMEKIALGVGLGVLAIVALCQWGGSDPTVQLGQKQVPVQDANRELLDQVNFKLHHPTIIDPKTDMGEVPPLDKDFEKALTAVLPEQITQTVAMSTPFTVLVDPLPKMPPPRKFELTELQAVIPAPEKPIAIGGPELRQTGETPSDQLVIHILGAVRSEAVYKNCAKLLDGYLVPQLTYLGIEVQAQELREDGAWGEATTVKGTSMPDAAIGGGAGAGAATELPTVPDWDGSNWDTKVSPAMAAVQAVEERLVQPAYWPILNNNRQFVNWTIRIPDWLVKYLYDYMNQTQPATPGQATTPTPTRSPAAPGGAMNPMRAPGAMNPMRIMMMHGMPTPGMPVAPAAPVQPVAGQPMPNMQDQVPPTLPAFTSQKTSLTLLWLHDESAAYNKVYRYRVRMVLLNPLLGVEKLAKTKSDAAQAKVYSPWSEWSDRVVVPRQTEAFLVGASAGMNEVTFRVFTRSLGQTVEERFSGHLGEVIGTNREKNVVSPLPPNEPVKQKVDFSTGLVVLAVDWKKKLAGGR